jgi:hypothetical protein
MANKADYKELTTKIVCSVWIDAVCCEALVDVTCSIEKGSIHIQKVWMRQFADAGGTYIDPKTILPSDVQKIIEKSTGLK